MAGITQPNVYPDPFSGGNGMPIYRSPLMRGRGPAPSGIGQGIDNLAAALVGPSPANQALAEDRQAQAELRKQQLVAGQAKLASDQQGREFDADPITNIATRLAGPEAAAYMNAGGQTAPPVPLDDEGNAFPKVPMERPARLSQAMEQNIISAALTHLANKTNMEQAAKAQQEQQTTAYRGAIAGDPTSGIDPAKVAAGFYATSGHAPFTEGTHGDTFSPLTGKSDVSGEIPQSYLGEQKAKTSAENALVPLRGAQAGQASAAAAASRAHAGLFNAQTENAKTGGGAGGQMYQDPTTGKKYQVNPKNGQAAMMTEDGTWQAVNPNELPNNLQKVGSIGAGGARENVYIGRVGLASAEAARDLENISKLPLSSSTGLFGGRTQGPGLFDATKNVLANTVTGQEAQSYNVKATGLMRNLAAIEAAGLMPTGNLTHQMDAVMWKEGDTQLTKLQRLAQTRQIVEAGLDHVMANPRVSDAEKAKMQEHVARMQRAVPFSHDDLDQWTSALDQNPNLTFGQFLASKPAPAAPPVAAPRAPGGGGGRTIRYDAQGNRLP